VGVGERQVLRVANGVAQGKDVDVDWAIMVDAVLAFGRAAHASLYGLRYLQYARR